MADAIHKQILDAFEGVIQALDLGGAERNIFQRMTAMEPWFSLNTIYPCIVISPVGTESIPESTSGTHDVSFPVTVRVIDRHAQDGTERVADYLLWRERIRDAFHLKRLSAVATVKQAAMQGSPVLEAEPLAYQKLSMPLVFLVEARKVR